MLVALIAVVATLGSFLVGPPVLRLLFGSRFALGRSDLIFLTAASGAYMLTLSVVQVQIALGHHARSAIGWIVGIGVFVVVTALGHSLLLRVEVGYLAGSFSAFVVASALLWHGSSDVNRGEPEIWSASDGVQRAQ